MYIIGTITTMRRNVKSKVSCTESGVKRIPKFYSLRDILGGTETWPCSNKSN